MIFAREASDNLVSLIKKIDAATVENSKKNMASFVTFLSDESGAAEKLTEVAKKNGIQKCVFSLDNTAGPKGYGVAKEADVTVVLYNQRKVEVNHAFRKGELNAAAIDKVVADIKKIVP
ncbi:MAG: hypothetical protein L0Y72_11100 [Gemmataceae bacterium]|nr:hypothetical protein [Gemmataceae bacterium]MCI0739583.1 hypothetical protein [Gemmataceae bacterium]